MKCPESAILKDCNKYILGMQTFVQYSIIKWIEVKLQAGSY